MGQIITFIDKILSRDSKKTVVFEHFIEDPKDYFEYYYPYYLNKKLIRPELFCAGIIRNLDCFQLDELILKYYSNNNPLQQKLIEAIEDDPYLAKDHAHDISKEFKILSKQLSYGRFLLYLIDQKLKFEKIINKEYSLKICNRAINKILATIDYNIFQYRNVVANDLADKGNIPDYKYTAEQVICAYIVFEEKVADNYFEVSLISSCIQKGLAFEIILNEWLIGESDPFLPNLAFENDGLHINKVNTGKTILNPLSYNSVTRRFKITPLVNRNKIKGIDKLKSGLGKLFSYIDNNYKADEADIFLCSISPAGVLRYSNFDFLQVQIQLNYLFKNEKNRWLFLCTLYLLRDTYTVNGISITLSNYFEKEVHLGQETFKKYLYRDDGFYIAPHIENYVEDLIKIIPLELSDYYDKQASLN